MGDLSVGQMLFDIIVGVAGFLGGFMLKAIWDEQKNLQQSDKDILEKVSRIEVLVAGEYVRREDFERTINAMFAKLDKIYDRLDAKQDKATTQ